MAGAYEFGELVKSLVNAEDRHLSVRIEHRLGGPSRYYEAVYVNFVNLPRNVGHAGGGAEAENNRMSFWVRGFHGADPHAPPPKRKVKVEMATSALPREYKLRAKTAEPEKVATYLASFINDVIQKVPPRFTHSSPGGTVTADDIMRGAGVKR